MHQNMRFGPTNFRNLNGPLSSAKKRPSDRQSRGERRLLSANAQKSSSSSGGQHKRDQSKQYISGHNGNGDNGESNNELGREEQSDGKSATYPGGNGYHQMT